MMNITSFSKNTLLASVVLALFSVGCGGGGSSTGAVSQAPVMYTISETTFDSSEDYLEVSSTSKPEESEIEDALLSRTWILFGTSLTVEDSSLGQSLRTSETPEEELSEFGNLLQEYAGRINVGALIIGDINATRLKYVGVQSFSEVSNDWKTYTI
ncbi:MAG: hypothetical protein QF645_10480, partial [Planctomycetota bacterium]|nr:hypothetical protein [Planctomycetota bacterium]